MSENPAAESLIKHPPRSLSRKSLGPILYLAERMANADEVIMPRETRIIDQLAKAAGLEKFRHEPWYLKMTEKEAIQLVSSDLAKQATMVILSLILKADMRRKDQEHAYFTNIRQQLMAEPVTVPVDLEAHTALAMEYIKD